MKIKILHLNKEVKKYFSKYQKADSNQEVNALVTGAKNDLNQKILAQYPNLKYIIQCSSGTEKIDKNYCREKEIIVFNSPTANANSVAEFVIGQMITSQRRILQANKSIREGKWIRECFKTSEFKDLTIGLIGFGQIAKKIHKKLSGFKPNYLVVDPFLTKRQIEIYDKTKKVELDYLLKNSDIISIHVPLIPATKYMITKNQLNLMKPGAILINTSRGGIIKEEDLITSLKNNKLYACLDNFENEPNVNPKFFELNNVILSPHMASMTCSGQEEMIKEAKRNFEKHLQLN